MDMSFKEKSHWISLVSTICIFGYYFYSIVMLTGIPIEEAKEMALFSSTDDYINLVEVIRDYPQWHEVVVDSLEEVNEIIGRVESEVSSIPVFIKRADGPIDIIPYSRNQIHLS